MTIDVTYGTGAANANNLKSINLNTIADFGDFIRGGATHVSKLDPSLGSLSSWHELPKKQRDILKVKCHYMIAGKTQGTRRKLEFVTGVNKLILDLDDNDQSHHDLAQKYATWSCVYFQTANSIGGARRWRVTLPLNVEVTVEQFKIAAPEFLRMHGISADSCSYNPCQAQMLPLVFDDLTPQVHVIDADFLDLTAYLTVPATSVLSAPVDDLDGALKNFRPVLHDVTREQITEELAGLDPSCSREEWLRVGMGLHHQYGGEEEGLEIWDEWSVGSGDKYVDGGCLKEYTSFNSQLSDRPPITIRSVCKNLGKKERTAARQEIRKLWSRKIARCADEGELRDQYTVEICEEIALGDYDRNLLAQAIQARLQEMAVTSTGRTVKPHPISEVREWLNPKRLTKNTPPNKGVVADLEDSWPAGWVYLQNGDEFMELKSKRRCSSRGFQAEFNRKMTGPDGVLMAPADVWALSLCEKPIEIVGQRMYAPGRPPVFTDDSTGIAYANEWNAETVPKGCPPEAWLDGDYRAVGSFLRLLTLLLPRRERKIFFYWMAWIVQNEGVHINWCPIIQGPQGAGKTMLSEIMRACLGAPNASSVDAHVLSTGFTSWAEGSSLKIIEEIRLPGEKGSAHSIINAMKPYITNNRVPIHRKGRDPFEVPNYTNYLMLTNHEDAIPIESGDRRYFVTFTTPRNEADVAAMVERCPGLFSGVFKAYTNHAPALRWYLENVKIPHTFQPFGHAPDSEFKHVMRGNTLPGDEAALAEVLGDVFEGCNGEGGVVTTAAITQRLRSEFSTTVRPARLAMLLRNFGYEKFCTNAQGKLRWRGRNFTVYVNPAKSGLKNYAGNVEAVRVALDATVGGEFK
tara:strand:- start:2166 stop:4739 length:2574 start_codon:yes stop_codon:yes gene_type:complete